MRFLMTVGALTMVGGLFVACGDDSGDGNTAGSGGTGGSAGNGGSAGSGGSAGTGGSAGAAGSGGSAGAAGSGGAAGNGGSGGSAGNGGSAGTTGDDPDAGDGGVSDAGDEGDAPCTGCLELRTGMASNTDEGFFQIAYGTALDMSGEDATVTFRVAGLSHDEDIVVQPFATDGSDFSFGGGAQVEVGTDAFVDLELDIGSIANADFDSTDVIAVGLMITFTGTIDAGEPADAGDAGANLENVSVLLDSVSFADIETDDLEFTNDAEGFAINAFAGVQTTSVVHH